MRADTLLLLHNLDPDARGWASRAASNGGSVSGSTRRAVSDFCKAMKSAGLWNKLHRVNLMCGDQLAAALVPLKIGSGNATDTNTGYVAADYTQVGGLDSAGGVKYLRTGVIPSTALTANDTHIAIYNLATTAGGGASIGSVNSGNGTRFHVALPFSDGLASSNQYNLVGGGLVSPAVIMPAGHFVASRTSATSHVIYQDATSVATNATVGGGLPAFELYAGAVNADGTPADYSQDPFAGYSIGAGLTAAEVTAYFGAMANFQAALGRVVFPLSSGFDRWINSVSGSDSYSGLGRGAPKQTIAGVGTIAAGLRYGFADGSVWRESFSGTAGGVVAGSYGSAATPIIDGSNAVLAASWAPTAGQPNVYEISKVSLVAFSGQHESLWLASGLAGTRATSLVNCNATAGTFFTDFTAGGAGTAYKIYVHPAGSTDPRVNGVTYYAAERLYCINLEGDGSVVDGMSTKRQLHHDGSLRMTGLNTVVRNCTASEGYIHDIYVDSGVIERCQTNNTEFAYSYVYNPAGSAKRLTVTDSRADYTIATAGPAFFMHGANSARLEMHRFVAENVECLFGTTDGRETLILNRCSHKAGTAGATKRSFDYQNQASPGASDLFIIRPTSIANILLYLNNLHAGSRVFIWEPIGINTQSISAAQCVEVHVVGGLLAATATGILNNFADASARANVTIKHTVMQLAAAGDYYLFAAGGSYTLDKNVYWNPAGPGERWNYNGSNYFSLATWQALGFDANSVSANALMTTNPATVTTLAGVEALFDASGKISVTSQASPLVTVGAGPGRVPSSYTFPSWVPADVRAMCLAAR